MPTRRWTFGVVASLLLAASANASGQSVVKGVVVRGATFEPAVGAQVRIVGGPVAVADEKGQFSLVAPASGEAVVEVSLPQHVAVRRTLTLPAGGEASLWARLEKEVLPGKIRGLVKTKGRDGPAPLEGAEIELGDGRKVKSGPGGEFLFEQVKPGLVDVKVRGLEHKPAEEVVSVPAGGEGMLELVLERTGERLPSVLRGRVRSTAGKPLRATLKVPEANLTAKTEDDGRFELQVPPGRYRFTIEAQGFVGQTKEIEVDFGDQALFYVDLSPTDGR